MDNILIVRLTAMGDVVLTLPAVAVLRQNFPTTRISFLTTKENDSLLRGFREVDETIALDRTALRSGKPMQITRELFRLLRRLRSEKYSLVVDLQGNGESAWLTRFTGATKRWGIASKSSRRWAYTLSTGYYRKIHPAESHCALLRHCGLETSVVQNNFCLPADALAAARKFFAEHHFNPEIPTLFVQPFTSGAHKNWPLENYLALGHHWQRQGRQVLFGGGPADRVRLEPVRAAGFAVSAGVPLLVTGGLMQLATLTVGGDTGALHLAVAQGKRVVMLMHRNQPGSPHPFQHSDWTVVPADCRNIAGLQLATVITTCEAALA